MRLPEARRSLNQKQCRYEPHILLVPQAATLAMKSSDHVLHTVHMDGAASFNVAFPFTDRIVTRDMNVPGLVNLRCNGGHVWMNAELLVVPHPYYAVTDEDGKFELVAPLRRWQRESQGVPCASAAGMMYCGTSWRPQRYHFENSP